MKKHFLLIPCLALSATLAQSQTQSGVSAPGQAGAQTRSPGQQQPGAAGQIGTQPVVPRAAAGAPPANVATNRVAGIIPGGDTNRIPFGGTNTEQFINDPSRPNVPGAVQFGSTNQVRFGATNSGVAAPGSRDGLPTNNTPFAGSGTIQDPSGAAANQTNPAGAQLRDPAAADALFAQQLNAALSRGGATRIFFPQTRSTITVVNQNGAILLTGFVSSDLEKQEIEARIKNSAGVASVENQLQVGNIRDRAIVPGQNQTLPSGAETDRRLLTP